MLDQRPPTFGFVGWNEFQFLRFRELARSLPGSLLIQERRPEHDVDLPERWFTDPALPVLLWDSQRMHELDGVFDVLVCQTPFTQIERIRRSKIAMLQYGLAKEPHNYGPWRSLADLCLVYGPYSAAKISYFCPVAEVGNPHFDAWGSPELEASARAIPIDRNRKTVLYLPTWGALSTYDVFVAAVEQLASEYNVLIKPHHSTVLRERLRRGEASSPGVNWCDAHDDLLRLLAVADVVLSDFSGAIFDALYCGRPVILLRDSTEGRFGEKLDSNSLEYAQAHRIGPVVRNPSELRACIKDVLSGRKCFRRENEVLRNELFVVEPGATARAASALLSLAHGNVPPLTRLQSYVRDEVRRHRLVRATRTLRLTRRDYERATINRWMREGRYERVLRYVELRSRLFPKLYLYRAGIRAAELLGQTEKASHLRRAAARAFPAASIPERVPVPASSHRRTPKLDRSPSSPEISKLQRPARLSLAGALNTWTGQSVASPGHRVGSLQRVFAKLRPVSVQGEPAFAALSLQQRRAVGSPAVLNLLSQALREQGYEAQADVLHRLAASSVAKPQARRPFFWKRAARH